MADAKPAGKIASPRISDVFFRESASFNDGSTSASVGMKDVVSIIPGCIDSNGRVATSSDSGERPSDGLLVTLRKHVAGKVAMQSYLVPWANVRDAKFEEVEVEKAA